MLIMLMMNVFSDAIQGEVKRTLTPLASETFFRQHLPELASRVDSDRRPMVLPSGVRCGWLKRLPSQHVTSRTKNKNRRNKHICVLCVSETVISLLDKIICPSRIKVL